MKQINALPDTLLTDRIYQHISRQPVVEEVSLLGGQMGYALVECYYQQYAHEAVPSQTWDRISASLEAIQNGELTHSFATGIAGVAWGFLHLFNHGLLQDDELDAQSIVEDLDQPLTDVALLLLQEGNYDYLHGALGVCLYLLERTPSPRIGEYLSQLVEQLAATATRFPNGDITWPDYNFGRRLPADPIKYNTGLSHGTTSIVSILALVYEKGYARNRCAELIQGNLQWLWRNRNQSGQSIFPDRVSESQADQECRLAWCYGDLGIANTFWLAGSTLSNEAWKQMAESVMVQAAGRRGDEARILDAAFCHGTAGATYIFRKFAQRTSNPVFSEAADYWLQKTMELVQPATEDDVFLTYHPGSGYVSNLSLLDGEASVLLVLLAEWGAPTHWDRFLLLS